MTKTIDYYDTNAQAFYDRTISADVSQSYSAFLKHLPKEAHILDAGCGVGRDSKYFLSVSYMVTAFDASKEMVRIASEETGLKVLQHTFQDIHFDQEFDGVWAQLSLIHIPYTETREVYQNIHRALKPSGIFCASYKYGNTHMSTTERDFWNMDESKVLPYFGGLFDVINIWTEQDMRSKLSPSPDNKLLNFIVRKI